MGPGLPPSLVLVVLLTGLARAQDILSNADTRPPTIFRVTHRNVYFSEKEKIELTCIADGNPKPVYHWLKDGNKLDITSPENSHRMHMKSNVGTLVISPASRSDEGIYQCVAQNNYGKSLSIKRNVYLARMAKFPTVEEPEKKRVLVGRWLKLECTPPESIPKAKISWIIVGSDAGEGDYPDENEDFNNVNLNRRITMDYDGNLYITQVIEEDAQSGARYVCMANNRIMRSFNQGEDKVVQPFGKARDQPVDLLWHSAPTVLGLQRRKANFKCIFSGRPQADITWNRIGGKWDDTRMMQSRDQYELTISNLKYDDQGDYECVGSDVVYNKELKQTFSLMVEAKPMWDKQPQNVTVGVEESASISCNPKGRPEPTVRWYINGNPIENEPPNPRRKLVGNTLHFSNVTRGDSQVIQCNASNTHGFIWADVFLHVLAMPAEVKKPPLKTLKVAEGQDITVTCESTGKPMPKVIWFKGDQQLSGARYQIKPNGNLVIKEVTDNDSGNYKCYASNRFGKDSANGTLLVREKTKIISAPLDLKLNHGNDAVFKCGAITDPAEELEYIWLRDGVRIENDEDPRVDIMDGTLKIMDVHSGDTAEYTCMASNGLDNATAKSALEVKAPPDPPYNLSLLRCFSTEAEISWVFDKELENFSPVQSFIVEYNTSFAPNKWTEGVRTSASSRSAKIALSLWVQYSFRVKAVNGIGVGKPSSITPSICKTPQGLPERHPRKVKTVGDKTNYLIIEWEPMDQIEHNGPGFFYNITVKGEDGVLMKLMETNHTVGRMEIKVDKIYVPYNITVGAQNVVGQPYIKPKVIRGYSGQATPKVVPENFELDPDKNVTATTAYFRWDPVDTSKEAMQGVFIGYTIRFWKVGQEDTTMHEVFIPQTNSDNGGRSTRSADKKVKAAVNNLPSYSEIEADVTARNTYFSSNSSNSIMFSTPEGVPSAVEYLEALFRGSTHFLLEWGEPEEPNGVIIGYKIGYTKINGLQLDEPEVGDMVTRRRMFLGNLEPDTLYRVSVWAFTQEGEGEEYYIDVRTAEMASELTQPKIDLVMPSDTNVNVTWQVSDTEGVRVGSHYYLEYRELGKGEWTRVKEARNDTFWQQIEGLESGMTYQVRVVAADGASGSNTYKKTPSEKRQFTTTGVGVVVDDSNEVLNGTLPKEAAAKANVLSAGWFIGMMVAIAILLLILIIVCIIKRNRGDKYHVQEKERLRGSNPDDGTDHFNEYAKSDENGVGQSQSFDNNPEKMPLETDETDSMEDYGDVDPGKFNEDGSFIGQYGVQKSSEPANASAMSTLV